MQLGVSYFGNRFVEHYHSRDLPRIVDAGCDFVVHTFSEHDLAFYTDAMREMVEATHGVGLQAWLDPWSVGGLFAGEAFSDFLVHNRDSWVVGQDGTQIPKACPNAPGTRALLRHWTEAAAAAGADAIFWDDPALGTVCHCAHCQEAFHSQHGASLAKADAATATRFLNDSLATLVQQLTESAVGHGMRNAVGVLPQAGLLRSAAHMDAVQAIATSPLWQAHAQPIDAYVRQASVETVEACAAAGKQPMAWLQAFGLAAGTGRDVVRAASIMRECGIESVAAWSYQAGLPMTGVRSERPAEAWQAVTEAFRLLKA